MTSKKAMISQPMRGLTPEQIIEARDKAIGFLTKEGYEVINTYFDDVWYDAENMVKRGVENIPLCFLARSMENMSLCTTVYMVKGWEEARGCKIEHEVAVAYGVNIIYDGSRPVTKFKPTLVK